MIVWLVFDKWEAWNGKQKFSHYTCGNLKGLGGQENWSKMEVQIAPTSQSKLKHGSAKVIFFEILMSLGKLGFFIIFGAG